MVSLAKLLPLRRLIFANRSASRTAILHGLHSGHRAANRPPLSGTSQPCLPYLTSEMDATTLDAGLNKTTTEPSPLPEREQQQKQNEPAVAKDSQQAGEAVDAPRGVKRPADDGEEGADDGEATSNETEPKLSKNQLRKLKRQKQWEEGAQDRRDKRKEKRKNKQERNKEAREAEIARAQQEGREPVFRKKERTRDPKVQTKVPVTVMIDCQFESYMLEKELVSLASQVTRCYSDNRTAQFPVHLYVNSYGGAMKERYESTLGDQVSKWRGITFTEEDFVAAAARAKEAMSSPEGGKVVDALKSAEAKDSLSVETLDPSAKARRRKAMPEPEPEPEDVDKSIVYLTADSPYVLERLEPNTCYVIGGIIDRNRHKGLCYKVARERKVRTAKLPIGEYMVLLDRHVLATNHVMEIMLRYLELGDWGAAFMKVIPTRKGGHLKDDEAASSETGHVEETNEQEDAGEEQQS